MTDGPTRSTDSPDDRLTFHITYRPGDGMYTDGPTASDPNAIFFWKGRCHFHYYGRSIDGQTGTYGHISSPDLVHWTVHPTVLANVTRGHWPLSGSGFMTKEGRPAIIYAAAFDTGLGPAQIVHALDDQLDSWSAPTAVDPQGIPDADLEFISLFDAHGWLEGDTYYAIFAAQPREPVHLGKTSKKVTLFKSADLESWEYVGPFLTTDLPEAENDTDISCPDFFPLGNEHMLLCISHNLGCRYYIGEWKDERFTPTRHGRMNWQPSKLATPEDVANPDAGRAVLFAPETFLTPDGRRVMWAWAWMDGLQPGIQCLPRELSLPDDGVLRIAPLRELETLRSTEVTIAGIEVSPSGISVVPGVAGDTLECAITFRFGSARRFGAVVLCDADGEQGLPIAIDVQAGTLTVGEIEAPFTVAEDSVTLRVFVDKAMVEVFADDRQAVIGAHPHDPGNVHVGVFADEPLTVDVTAWELDSIYADEPRSDALAGSGPGREGSR